MKEKKLRYPFSWQERRPLLTDQVLFVPEYYQGHQEFTMPSWQEIFKNDNPILIEYCSGNGAWIIDKAEKEREKNFIAVEKRFERVQKIHSKMKKRGLSNMLIVAGEALITSSFYFKDESFDQVCVHFPDPWPKEKHAKNRLFQKPFVDEIRRLTKKGAVVRAVTDDVHYSEQIIEKMQEEEGFISSFPHPHYINEWKDYGTSYFEELWRSKGRSIRYMEFQRK